MSELRRQFPAPPEHARALVLCAHPQRSSFNSALADAWTRGAIEAGVTVETMHLSDLDFVPTRHAGHSEELPLEPDLARVQAAIAAAAHVVVAFPVWWGSTPAVLQGLFDRALLPGWAFTYVDKRPVSGLSGRSARMLVTMDAPVWYDSIVYGASARRQVGRATLRFCGFAPVRTSAFGSIGTCKPEQRERMLTAAESAGRADGAVVAARFAGPKRIRGIRA